MEFEHRCITDNLNRMATFFSLPPEVRTMIYILVLDVSPAKLSPYLASQIEILRTSQSSPPDERGLHTIINALKWKTIQALNISLLATCSIIKNEASPILYSRNTFFLHTTSTAVKFFENALHNHERRSWIKSIYLKLMSFSSRNPLFADLNVAVFESWPSIVSPIVDHMALDLLVLDFYYMSSLPACLLSTFNEGFAHRAPRNLELRPPYGKPEIRYNPWAMELMETWTLQRRSPRVTLKEGLKLNGRLIRQVEAELAHDESAPLPSISDSDEQDE